MKTVEQITEEAAEAVIKELSIERSGTEPATDALGWEIGDGALTYEEGLRSLVAQAVEIDRADRDNQLEQWAAGLRESLTTDKSNDWSKELAELDQIIAKQEQR